MASTSHNHRWIHQSDSLENVSSKLTLKHPSTIPSSEWIDDMKRWPLVEYKNIFNYLVLSVGVDGEAMENFKSLESYQYFHAFKVGAVMFNEPASDMCFLKAEVTPSQAVKATKHTAWVLVTSAGVVETAGCTCIAGQGESCSRAGAILWKLEYATATGRSGKSCTDESQRWNKGTIQNLEAQRLENISFKRKRHPSTLGNCDIQPTGRGNLPDLPAPLTPEDFVKFVDTSSVSELFKLPRSIINAACIAEPLQFTVLPDLVHSEHSDQLFCEPCKKFFLDYMHVCDSQQCNLEKETKGQSTSVAWRDARRLRITGSSAKKVSVRATTSAENFLREQLYPSFRGNYATEHGRTSEPKTLQALKEMAL